jgi:hypothetical protein
MKSISDSFQLLLQRIQLSSAEIRAATVHLATIESRLTKTLDVKKFFKAGSFSRGSSIIGKSDVDAFVVLSRDSVRWGGGQFKSSHTVLDEIRTELTSRFPKTSVARDINSIVVDFKDYRIDVVPAVFAEFPKEHRWPLYWIPDGTGTWMVTSPERQNAYIKQENEVSCGKLRFVAQLLKFWRECRVPRVPLSSFHIEMVLAATGICKGPKSYANCMAEVFKQLAERECRAIADPLEVCGRIPAVKSEPQRESALASVRHSRDHAKAGLEANVPGKLQDARHQWDIVFNGNFPW